MTIYFITPDLNIEERTYNTQEELLDLLAYFGGYYATYEEAYEAVQTELERRYGLCA